MAGGLAAIAVAYAPIPHFVLAALIGSVAVGVVMVTSARATAVLAGASLPELQDLSGHALGLHLAASDVVLALIAVGLSASAVRSRRFPTLRALRPMRVPFIQYAWILGLVLVLHPSVASLAKSVQRLELIGLPLLAGAFIALRRQQLAALKAYILAATVLAAAWPGLHASGLAHQFDKNPTGQMIANALLLLLAVRGLRRYLVCVPILILGLVLTASRGALLSVVVGIGVLFLFYGSQNRRAAIARLLVVVATAAGAYLWLPGSVTSQVTTFSAARGAVRSFPIYIREQFNHDAVQLIGQHPWTGVGIGDYRAGSLGAGTLTTDPHDTLLLQAAEGGLIYAASFLVLIGGAVVLLWRRRRTLLAPAAAAVLLATLAHAIVDIYWARGTPDLGWLLVGMVCAGGAAQGRLRPPGQALRLARWSST